MAQPPTPSPREGGGVQTMPILLLILENIMLAPPKAATTSNIGGPRKVY